MGLRLFTDDDGWDEMRDNLRYSVAGVRASKVHAALAKPLLAALGRWDELDQSSLDATGAVVDGNAAVAWCNGELDADVKSHARQVLDDCGGDRESKQYRAYYKGSPSDITDLALEAEIDALKHFVEAAKAYPPSKALAARNAAIQADIVAGKAALAQRLEAALGVTRVSLAKTAWREGVNKARRTLHALLTTYANEHDEGRDYADRFFPPAKRGRSGGGGTGGAAGGRGTGGGTGESGGTGGGGEPRPG